jgi:stress response protein YsnF
MHTVIGAFDDKSTAERAVERLAECGFDRQDVHLQQDDSSAAGYEADRELAGQEREVAVGRRGFFARLFGLDDDHATHAHTYTEAVRRGSSVVVVDAQDETDADRAASLLHELGAVDVDERAKGWRAEGWNAGVVGDRSDAQRLASTGAVRDGEQVLNVVQEELKVGKRSLDRGGVRVVERVSQQPVREIVQLRDERAVVDRRAVDRPASPDELSNTRENTVEVREMTEEPVVSKTARVVEEVRVGKEVRAREQTIEDSVRRKDVDVQRMQGGVERERERAVAADDQTQLPLGEREVDGDATGTRNTTKRKDKPSF